MTDLGPAKATLIAGLEVRTSRLRVGTNGQFVEAQYIEDLRAIEAQATALLILGKFEESERAKTT